MKQKLVVALFAVLSLVSSAFAGTTLVHNGGYTKPVANATTGVFLAFSVVDHDNDGFFNPAYPTRLTVPAGVTKARFCAQLIFASNSNGIRQLVVKKNYPAGGGWFAGVPAYNARAIYGTTTDIGSCTPWIIVQAGDFFEVEPYQDSGAVLDMLGSVGTFFAVETKP